MELEISEPSVVTILHDNLNMSKVSISKVGSTTVESWQKLRRQQISQSRLEALDNDPDFLDEIMTGDETWGISGIPKQNQNP